MSQLNLLVGGSMCVSKENKELKEHGGLETSAGGLDVRLGRPEVGT